MTCQPTGRELLLQAICYALPIADLVTPPLRPAPTPCAGWDLGMLLSHFSESLDALTEGLTQGAVSLTPAAPEPPGIREARVEAACLRVRFGRLQSAIQSAPTDRPVVIAGHDMTEVVVTCTGAIEISVHGWDIATACGYPRPIPDDLASPLLEVAPALLPGTTRAGLFAEPLPPGLGARPGERLLAFLGRSCPLRPSAPLWRWSDSPRFIRARSARLGSSRVYLHSGGGRGSLRTCPVSLRLMMSRGFVLRTRG